jgi:hypothetical protein
MHMLSFFGSRVCLRVFIETAGRSEVVYFPVIFLLSSCKIDHDNKMRCNDQFGPLLLFSINKLPDVVAPSSLLLFYA